MQELIAELIEATRVYKAACVDADSASARSRNALEVQHGAEEQLRDVRRRFDHEISEAAGMPKHPSFS